MKEEFGKAWEKWKAKLLAKNKNVDLKQAKLWFRAGWRAREIVAGEKLRGLLVDDSE